METKYTRSMRAGIIGGIIISIIAVTNAFFGVLIIYLSNPVLDVLSFAIGFVALALAFIAFLGTGALSAKFSREWITGLDHAVLFGGIAGCSASLITIAVSLVIAFAAPFFNAGSYDTYPEIWLVVASLGSLMRGAWQCFCSPFIMVTGTFLGIFGSAIYAMVTKKELNGKVP